MRQRLFKQIFQTSMIVFFVCTAILAAWLYETVAEVGVLQLFMPILVVAVLAVVLSLLLAVISAKEAAESLSNIDFSRPDERDVEDEIKPLVRRLADQNKQIRSQMEALAREHDRQDKMRREFTANVSHELKTPLTSISGFAELIRDGMVQQEDIPRFAGKIHDEASRMITLVGDIIRLSRLEDQSLPQAAEMVSLRETAAAVLQQLSHAAEKKQLTLVLSGGDGRIRAVPQMVEEILYNLCDNAIQYNRPGGTVTVEIRELEQGAEISVADTGIGIPKEEQPRVFERFYRVDKSHSRANGGTGLGLSIVKHGAAALGAQVSLESIVGIGTTITVSFLRNPPVPQKEDAE